MLELIPLLLFACVCGALMLGYNVAFTLAGVSLWFAVGGNALGIFDIEYLTAAPSRIFGIMTNETLLAVPIFVLMGVTLEKSKVAEKLLMDMARAFGGLPGGLGLSVTVVGMLLAASTGIVGATVVTMGLLSLPSMLRSGYSPSLATGAICATGTLGQIIPPSIALVLLGDVLSSSYQQAQIDMGAYAPDTVSVGDLFAGAIIPGLLLVALYMMYIFTKALVHPESAPAVKDEERPKLIELVKSLSPPLTLIVLVLGSILSGFATPTEAASVGAVGATALAAANKALNLQQLRDIVRSTLHVTCMVFMILVGASIFSAVFRGYGGEELMQSLFTAMPGGVVGAMVLVMLIVFLLGFILDFIEITYVVVPIVAPVLFMMGVDPVWLGIMLAINLQTSFLTPPFGFALFYLRGVAGPEVATKDIYKGVIPFIVIQILAMAILSLWPTLATWLPDTLNPPVQP